MGEQIVSNKLGIKRRQIPLFVLLGLVVAAWMYTMVDGVMMRAALDRASVDDIEDSLGGPLADQNAEIIKKVSAYRESILFGPATGRVTLYIKSKGPSGNPEYSGIEIGFEKQDDEWVMTDSRGFEMDEVVVAAEAFGATAADVTQAPGKRSDEEEPEATESTDVAETPGTPQDLEEPETVESTDVAETPGTLEDADEPEATAATQ